MGKLIFFFVLFVKLSLYAANHSDDEIDWAKINSKIASASTYGGLFKFDIKGLTINQAQFAIIIYAIEPEFLEKIEILELPETLTTPPENIFDFFPALKYLEIYRNTQDLTQNFNKQILNKKIKLTYYYSSRSANTTQIRPWYIAEIGDEAQIEAKFRLLRSESPTQKEFDYLFSQQENNQRKANTTPQSKKELSQTIESKLCELEKFLIRKNIPVKYLGLPHKKAEIISGLKNIISNNESFKIQPMTMEQIYLTLLHRIKNLRRDIIKEHFKKFYPLRAFHDAIDIFAEQIDTCRDEHGNPNLQIIQLHGVAGIGKSSFIRTFADMFGVAGKVIFAKAKYLDGKYQYLHEQRLKESAMPMNPSHKDIQIILVLDDIHTFSTIKEKKEKLQELQIEKNKYNNEYASASKKFQTSSPIVENIEIKIKKIDKEIIRTTSEIKAIENSFSNFFTIAGNGTFSIPTPPEISEHIVTLKRFCLIPKSIQVNEKELKRHEYKLNNFEKNSSNKDSKPPAEKNLIKLKETIKNNKRKILSLKAKIVHSLQADYLLSKIFADLKKQAPEILGNAANLSVSALVKLFWQNPELVIKKMSENNKNMGTSLTRDIRRSLMIFTSNLSQVSKITQKNGSETQNIDDNLTLVDNTVKKYENVREVQSFFLQQPDIENKDAILSRFKLTDMNPNDLVSINKNFFLSHIAYLLIIKGEKWSGEYESKAQKVRFKFSDAVTRYLYNELADAFGGIRKLHKNIDAYLGGIKEKIAFTINSLITGNHDDFRYIIEDGAQINIDIKNDEYFIFSIKEETYRVPLKKNKKNQLSTDTLELNQKSPNEMRSSETKKLVEGIGRSGMLVASYFFRPGLPVNDPALTTDAPILNFDDYYRFFPRGKIESISDTTQYIYGLLGYFSAIGSYLEDIDDSIIREKCREEILRNLRTLRTQIVANRQPYRIGNQDTLKKCDKVLWYTNSSLMNNPIVEKLQAKSDDIDENEIIEEAFATGIRQIKELFHSTKIRQTILYLAMVLFTENKLTGLTYQQIRLHFIENFQEKKKSFWSLLYSATCMVPLHPDAPESTRLLFGLEAGGLDKDLDALEALKDLQNITENRVPSEKNKPRLEKFIKHFCNNQIKIFPPKESRPPIYEMF